MFRCNILGSSPSSKKANKEQQSSQGHVLIRHDMSSTFNMEYMTFTWTQNFNSLHIKVFLFPALPTLQQGGGLKQPS